MTAEATLTYGDVLKTVLGVFFKRAYALVGAAALIAWIAAFAKALRRKVAPARLNASSAVLAVIALLPFAWYFCTQNHSYIHAFYTSRNLSVSVFALCCLFQSLLPKNLYKSDDL